MPANKKIDDARFATMWLEGVPAHLIAEAFRVTEVTVSATWKRLDLPPRRPGGELRELGAAGLRAHIRAVAALDVAPETVAAAFGVRAGLVRDLYADIEAEARRDERGPSPVQTVPGRALWARDRDARLLQVPPPARYATLADLAAGWGVPMREVQARWHRLRAGA